MTHDPSHTIWFLAGVVYFALAAYFSFRNYKMTHHEGYWFFMFLFSLSMLGVMVSGTLWSSRAVEEDIIHAFHDIFFLIASILLLDATYTLHKKEHRVKVF
jgi:predicted membrane channel-forming protein YqfA (hemolysin III family)